MLNSCIDCIDYLDFTTTSNTNKKTNTKYEHKLSLTLSAFTLF